MVYKIKGKTIDKLYKKSRLVIQVYNNKGKVEILTQSLTIQYASQRLMVILAPLLLQLKERDIHIALHDIV